MPPGRTGATVVVVATLVVGVEMVLTTSVVVFVVVVASVVVVAVSCSLQAVGDTFAPQLPVFGSKYVFEMHLAT